MATKNGSNTKVLGTKMNPSHGRNWYCVPKSPIRYGTWQKRTEKIRVVSHLFTGSLAGIGKLPALAGWCLVWYVRYFLYCKIWWELHFVKFCGNSPQKGGLVHQKGGRSKRKRGSRQMYDTEGPYQVFLRYRFGKYQENNNQYHTEIPNWDTTLEKIHSQPLSSTYLSYHTTTTTTSKFGERHDPLCLI